MGTTHIHHHLSRQGVTEFTLSAWLLAGSPPSAPYSIVRVDDSNMEGVDLLVTPEGLKVILKEASYSATVNGMKR